ncbi:MAG: hypothetical protein JNL98_27745 [Bryobacterales bacterium]|nr:hypothetical protein [Bryobacterales bacterium]
MASELVHLATRAPSGHNTQPWRFSCREDRITIHPDLTRRLPVADPDDHELYVSLGCALENLTQAARARGFDTDISIFEPASPESITVTLTAGGERDPVAARLASAIADRQSTRSPFERTPVPMDVREALFDASHESGVRGLIFTEQERIRTLAELACKASAMQAADAGFREELVSWIRFSGREAEAHGDGLFAKTIGLPAMPRWLGAPILRRAITPSGDAGQTRMLIGHCSALMLFLVSRHDRSHWVRAGMAFERVALTATMHGLKHSHVNTPCEVPGVRDELREWLACGDEYPVLLIRLGYGGARPYSSRRPLKDVLM